MVIEIVDNTEEPPVTRNYTFDTLADVMRYWSELEFVSLHKTFEDDAVNTT